MVENYQKALGDLVSVLYDRIQNMDFSDCGSYELLSPKPEDLPNGWRYWYEKISCSVLGGGYDPWYWEERIIELFSPYFTPKYKDSAELYLLVNAVLFALLEKEKKEKENAT